MTRFALRVGVPMTLASGLAACAAQEKSAGAPRSEADGSAATQQQQQGAPPSTPTLTSPSARPLPQDMTQNACRALGSMDRTAGRLCGLTQGDSETRRCDDAKQRVYAACDRVKATCGQCDNGASVDRTTPIPSLR